MYWRITLEDNPGVGALDHVDGRFVLHKHRDDDGPHLDLRLEMNGYLMGWRIDSLSLETRPWATEKAPHALRWLDVDADAECLDAGLYAMQHQPGRNTRELLLKGTGGIKRLTVERAEGLPARVARDVALTLREQDAQPVEAPRLIRDGIEARRRAVERLCGLGRELDGNVFDAESWRKQLAGLSLEEIQSQLRAYEVRFDQKYPPSPVSRPERLQEELNAGAALSIARE